MMTSTALEAEHELALARDDVEHYKYEAQGWEELCRETHVSLLQASEGISRAIDEIALTDKTRDGLRRLRVARAKLSRALEATAASCSSS